MSKRITIASGRISKLCAVALAVAAFSDVAAAQYQNSADAYAFPFGNKSSLDHQVKTWNVNALAAAQDAIFYYSDDHGVLKTPDVQVGAAIPPVLVAAEVAPAAPAAPAVSLASTSKAGPAQRPIRADKRQAPTLIHEASAPAASNDKAALIQAILDRYTANQIDAKTTAALLADVITKNGTPAPVAVPVAASEAPRPAAVAPSRPPAPDALMVTAAPVASPASGASAARTWPIHPNATVRDTLAEWAHLAGWNVPQWTTGNTTPYRIAGGKPPTGTFMDALGVLSEAIPQFDIHATPNTHDLVVTDHIPKPDSTAVATAIAYAKP
jgi:hypothetical protein